MALIAIFTGQHALVEGVPGVAKTLLVRTLARVLGCEYNRIQFTPDLMPTDITGTHVFNLQTSEFSLVKGPVFTTFLLADEINRAPAKTQAALLQAMQERRVTIDRDTYELSPGFTVFATQNPVEYEGTYPLPEAQKDRFMLKIPMNCPNRDEELTLARRMLGEDSPEADARGQLGAGGDRRADDLPALRAQLRGGDRARGIAHLHRGYRARHPRRRQRARGRRAARDASAPAGKPRRGRDRRPRFRHARRRKSADHPRCSTTASFCGPNTKSRGVCGRRGHPKVPGGSPRPALMIVPQTRLVAWSAMVLIPFGIIAHWNSTATAASLVAAALFANNCGARCRHLARSASRACSRRITGSRAHVEGSARSEIEVTAPQ